MPLLANQRHERFAQELASGRSTEDAYVRAGFTANRGNCVRLKQRPDVQARVAELMGNAAERVEITQARVLEELAKIGFSDLRKLFSDTGHLIPIHELEDDAAACLSSIELITRKVAGGDKDEVESVAKVKVWDKRAALVDIGKHLGMFKERVEHTGKDGGPIETVDLSDRDVARRIAFVLSKGSRQPTSH